MQKVDEHGHTQKHLPRNLDVTLLELFDCIGRTRNLTLAGQEMGMSQPAVSRALSRLREMYGDPLFTRQPRGVSPTPFAETLAPAVVAALASLRLTFQRPTFDIGKEERTFRIAMADIGERLFLPRLMQRVAQIAPHVVLEAVSSQSDLEEGLRSGQIDLAVGFFGALGKQFHQHRLFRERFVYVAKKGHPQIHQQLRREQLRDIPHVVAGPQGMEHASAVQRVLASARVKARVALRVHSFLCMGPIIATTDMIGVIPSNLAAEVGTHLPLQLLAAPVQFPGFDVTLVWHQRYHMDPGNRWMRDVFKELFHAGVGA